MFLRQLKAVAMLLLTIGLGAGAAERGAKEAPAAPGEGRLLFYRQGHLTLIGPDGKDEKQVSKNRDKFMPGPAWLSPDGRRIAFLVQVGIEVIENVNSRQKVYVRGLDEAEPGTDVNVEAQHVAWSPDGRQLVAAEYFGAKDPRDVKITNWLVDLKTKEKTALKLPDNHAVRDWSRDGKYFLTLSYGFTEDGPTWHLHLMNRDGSEARALTDGSHPVDGGRLSPDGRRLLYLAPDPQRKGKGPGLFVLDVARGKSVRVEGQPLNGHMGSCYCWSPDGKRIAYSWRQFHEKEEANQETESALVVADADGSHPVTIATEKGDSAGLITLALFDWR